MPTKTKQKFDVKTVDTSDLALQTNLFDYSSLDANTAKLAKESAIEIKAREKAIWENIIEIGNRLIEVKTALPHGQFEEWVKSEFKWSAVIARKYMIVSSELKNETQGFDLFPNSLKPLYALASGLANADEETKEEILTAVEEKTEEKGKALTEKEIKEITSKIKEEYEQKIKDLKGDCRLLQASKDWLDKELEVKNNTVENQKKVIQETHSKLSQLEAKERDLKEKEERLNKIIEVKVQEQVTEKTEEELRKFHKQKADLEKEKAQIKDELKAVESLKRTAQLQKDNFDSTQEWITNFQLTNEYLQQATNELKKFKNSLQKNPNLSELEDKEKAKVEAKIKELIVDFNDNLHHLGGAINYLNGAVVKFNNHALKVLDAEVVNND